MADTTPAVDLDKIVTRTTISVEEAASLLGIGRTAAYEAARRGQLPTRRLGRRLVVPVPAFLDWLGSAHADHHR
jgi:excisionase family DNA binding protein